MQTVWSASRAPSESRSASECASTASMPSSWQARIMRTAISPRLATSMRLILMGIANLLVGYNPTNKTGQISCHHHTAVDVQHLASDVRCQLGRQECHHTCHL